MLLVEFILVLGVVQSLLDLLDLWESYDLIQCLGDIGVVLFFVGIVLVIMVSYFNGDSSMVMLLWCKDQVILIGISLLMFGKKFVYDLFGVDLLLQIVSGDGLLLLVDLVVFVSWFMIWLLFGEDYVLEEFLSSFKFSIDWQDDLQVDGVLCQMEFLLDDKDW